MLDLQDATGAGLRNVTPRGAIPQGSRAALAHRSQDQLEPRRERHPLRRARIELERLQVDDEAQSDAKRGRSPPDERGGRRQAEQLGGEGQDEQVASHADGRSACCSPRTRNATV